VQLLQKLAIHSGSIGPDGVGTSVETDYFRKEEPADPLDGNEEIRRYQMYREVRQSIMTNKYWDLWTGQCDHEVHVPSRCQGLNLGLGGRARSPLASVFESFGPGMKA